MGCKCIKSQPEPELLSNQEKGIEDFTHAHIKSLHEDMKNYCSDILSDQQKNDNNNNNGSLNNKEEPKNGPIEFSNEPQEETTIKKSDDYLTNNIEKNEETQRQFKPKEEEDSQKNGKSQDIPQSVIRSEISGTSSEAANEYCRYMLTEINSIRKNPSSFIPLVEQGIDNIKTIKDNNNNDRLIYKGKVKVSLTKGREAFEETIKILSDCYSMDPLEFDESLCIPLPTDKADIKNREYIKNQVKIIKKTRDVGSYWKDFVEDKEAALVLMVVDDNGKTITKKRNDLLNPEWKYVGITSGKIGKTFVAYFVFSK